MADKNDSAFDGFGFRPLGRAKANVSPIGLAGSGVGNSKGPSYEVYKYGLECGINLFMWSPRFKNLTRALLELPVDKRAELFIVTGIGAGGPRQIRKALRSNLNILGIDKFSSFNLFWVRSEFRVRDSVTGELQELREKGLCDNIGLSTHNRKLAHGLYEKGIFDLFMLRYNAAHRGLEKDFLDRINQEKPPAVTTYTATRWGKLLERPRGWDGPVPRPGDFYRFQLSHPGVTATWMSPKIIEELKSNLDVLAEGPLNSDEANFIRQFGDRVHSRKSLGITNFFERSNRF